MKATPATTEPAMLERWSGLYQSLRSSSAGRPRFVLHDGPPYANGHLHMGHALNKVLKDMVVRSRQMRGYDAAYVPGWDCHGLPIETKVEEELRQTGRCREDVGVLEFRELCRRYAARWVAVQAAEFKRLGVLGDFDHPYSTMSFEAEATIASELMSFAASGQLYLGCKPVMWSVADRTALADSEVEHKEYQSDAVWVKFPLAVADGDLRGSSVVVWTTTPWTLPANRAVAYSAGCGYALFEVVSAERDHGPKAGERMLLSSVLSDSVARVAKLVLKVVRPVGTAELRGLVCRHPLSALGYAFDVPLLEGDHVTHDAGTGFVHTAPGHGTDDFELWMKNADLLAGMGVSTDVPFTVDDAGYLTDAAPGFGPSSPEGAARVLDDNGDRGDANERVVSELKAASALVARNRHKHAYPHSQRRGMPVLYRNTRQWFVPMDKELGDGTTLRSRALSAIDRTEFCPASGRTRLRSMVAARPDWVLSRQRRWGVPLTVLHDENGTLLVDAEVNRKIVEAFRAEGSDAWFTEGARERFLSHRHDVERWKMATDVLDVWFDSGCTHAFVLDGQRSPPADVYLEGHDQHRGWFQSSLLESCATRGNAPYRRVVTHGFALADNGDKMSKSKGNAVSPMALVEKYGADTVRMWVAMSDYTDDIRFDEKVLKTVSEAMRKVRNTFRWMTGMLAHHDGGEVARQDMPELELYMLHRLAELDAEVRDGYDTFDFKRVFRAIADFMNADLSSFYFMARKDALYCDAADSLRRRASMHVLSEVFRHLALWIAPMLPFLAEEVWDAFDQGAGSVHLSTFPGGTERWIDEELAAKWSAVMATRSLVNSALEMERRAGRMGSPLEAHVTVHVGSRQMLELLSSVALNEVCVTSVVEVTSAPAPENAVTDGQVAGVAVVARKASGRRCARSWIVTEDVGRDREYPDLSPRDAAAMMALAAA